MWVPPEGVLLIAHEPQEVRIGDREGQQQGANHWEGLRELMAETLEDFAERNPWKTHSCNLCRKSITVDGQSSHSMKAAVLDGITNTRSPCCAVHECPYPLPDLGGSR